ncbi:MAG: hypothetical protein AW08_00555 [Candidatus Accumulibacter adjunctus]|uniref:Uncharacterized protein n=1 Tax=Candidatus Accumulibacter adjunctus TaxID=1454001 RepID=A0A011NXI0_9PROT|nr:MAG: hypothetical protein AW08_00555 [Candidatus Accumulibacter adjunctus]
MMPSRVSAATMRPAWLKTGALKPLTPGVTLPAARAIPCRRTSSSCTASAARNAAGVACLAAAAASISTSSIRRR